jgi:hypothetical protein
MAAPSGVALPTTGSALGAVALQVAAGGPSADGVIQDGEYRHKVADPETRMALSWQNDSTTLCVGLSSPGTGWAAVGFSSQDGKKGSNLLIGAVRDGKVVLQDHIGENRIDHRQDKVSSILTAGGSEAGGGTTLEFSIPLSSGDAEDVALVPGQNVAAILAFQASSDELRSGALRPLLSLDHARLDRARRTRQAFASLLRRGGSRVASSPRSDLPLPPSDTLSRLATGCSSPLHGCSTAGAYPSPRWRRGLWLFTAYLLTEAG